MRSRVTLVLNDVYLRLLFVQAALWRRWARSVHDMRTVAPAAFRGASHNRNAPIPFTAAAWACASKRALVQLIFAESHIAFWAAVSGWDRPSISHDKRSVMISITDRE
jgi:hypothetical protein